MTHMSIVSAVLTMAAIAVERYMTIARPRSPHLSKKVRKFTKMIPFLHFIGQATYLMLVFIWVTSVFLATPALIYSNTSSYGDNLSGQLRWAQQMRPGSFKRASLWFMVFYANDKNNNLIKISRTQFNVHTLHCVAI